MEEKVYFKTTDNLTLCGILSIPQKPTQKCIVLCHGLGGDVDKDEDGIFTNLAEELRSVGFAVFRFDFRGHGESEGEQIDMTITGEKKDLESAVNFLKKKGFKEFGLLGASFGGGAVSLYMGENPINIKAVVLWNALIDYGSKMNPVTKWGKKYWGREAFERAEKFGFTEIGSSKYKAGRNLMNELKIMKPYQLLMKLEIPILFIHGDQDSYISYQDSVQYAKLMKNAKLVTIPGAEHGFHDKKEDAELAIQSTVEFFLQNM